MVIEEGYKDPFSTGWLSLMGEDNERFEKAELNLGLILTV